MTENSYLFRVLENTSLSCQLRVRRVSAGVRHALLRPDVSAGALQPDGIARRAEADLHLRADVDPLDVAPKGLDQERVALVTAVIAHLLPQEARRHPDPHRRVAHASSLSRRLSSSRWAR